MDKTMCDDEIKYCIVKLRNFNIAIHYNCQISRDCFKHLRNRVIL